MRAWVVGGALRIRGGACHPRSRICRGNIGHVFPARHCTQVIVDLQTVVKELLINYYRENGKVRAVAMVCDV